MSLLEKMALSVVVTGIVIISVLCVCGSACECEAIEDGGKEKTPEGTDLWI